MIKKGWKMVKGFQQEARRKRKLKQPGELVETVNDLRRAKKKIVFTNGCFDIIHSGHINYLSRAKEMGDILIIGLNSDDSVRRLKGDKRPINNVNDRATVLDALEMIDYIVIFDEDTPYNLIKHIKPDVLVKGGDWVEEEIVGSDIVKAYGGVVESLPFYEGYSTTGTIEKLIRNGL